MSVYNKKYHEYKLGTPENNCFWSRVEEKYYDVSELEPDDVENLELFNTEVCSFSLDIEDELHEHFEGEDYLSTKEQDRIAEYLSKIEAIVNRHPMYSPIESRPPENTFEKEERKES